MNGLVINGVQTNMDEEIAKERILETANLTDGLADDEANWLIDWGIGHIHTLIGSIADDEVAGKKIINLMAIMRTLNQIVADRAAKPAATLAEDIRTYMTDYAQVFG